jgi:hypothetical protein
MRNTRLFIAALVLFAACTTEPEDTFETETLIHNAERVISITVEYKKINNTATYEAAFNPGTYSMGEDKYVDGVLVSSNSPFPQITVDVPIGFSTMHYLEGFSKSVGFKIYNYQYDPNDSTVVINKELLAEANIYRR